ncbi:MAG: LPS export ABC transporter ATP-binding protein [Spirochaetes bacterium]|nr:LPS export ABC transporter ATP-binding protein [Spirochaetota bacterium]
MFALTINHISKTYRRRLVVDDVSFHVNEGEVVGLLGPNGAGKTTSFYMTVGLVKPEKGSVYCNEVDVTFMPMYRRARNGIGYLPQEASVFRKLTVRKNLEAILETMDLPREKIPERCEALLKQFNIWHVRDQYGYTLSGGERRRTEIARALCADPKILLLDEPFAGVDPIAVRDIQQVIREIQKLGIGILITDHNVRETLKIVSRAYIMNQGRILMKGTAQELIDNPKAREIYLGEDFTL